VAASNPFVHHDLRSLSQLDNCRVESDEPDPRGWTVFMSDGRQIGTVIDLLIDDDLDKDVAHVRFLLVDIDGGALPGISGSGSTALVSIEDVDIDGGSHRVIARAIACDDIHGLPPHVVRPIDPPEDCAPMPTV
jgi:hypothetical protein